MPRVSLTQDDLNLRRQHLERNQPSAETMARGRLFFEQQARECRTLALKFPEMLPAALKFERWSKLPDEELAHHWPLARARLLWNLAVRAEIKCASNPELKKEKT